MNWVLIVLLAGDQWALPLDLRYPTVGQCEDKAREWRSYPWTVEAVCLPAIIVEDENVRPQDRRPHRVPQRGRK